MANELLNIEVYYAPPTPGAPLCMALRVAAGATVAQAIEASAIEHLMLPQALRACKVGIWGKLKPLETCVRERDRIELYRPLIADPKEARRYRAGKKLPSQA
ncbi:MAG: RnfH family protein [Herminiimonas sp.]|nr:RnfH family protein [Herminiimonas sp.]